MAAINFIDQLELKEILKLRDSYSHSAAMR